MKHKRIAGVLVLLGFFSFFVHFITIPKFPFDLSTAKGKRQYEFAKELKAYKDWEVLPQYSGYNRDCAKEMRMKAVANLKSLSDKYPDAEEAKCVKELFMPFVGRRAVHGVSFRYDGNHKFGMAKDRGVDISLLYIDVKQYGGIQFTFSITNPSHKEIREGIEYLLYVFQSNPKFERLYILDDNGNKFYSTTGFAGGKQKQDGDGSDLNRIFFNPGERVIMFLEFPMISYGGTKIAFVSPQLNGWQDLWWISCLELKTMHSKSKALIKLLESEEILVLSIFRIGKARKANGLATIFIFISENIFIFLGLGCLFVAWHCFIYEPHPAEEYIKLYRKGELNREKAVEKVASTFYDPNRDGIPSENQSKNWAKRLDALTKRVKAEEEFMQEVIKYIKTKSKLES